MYVCLWTYSVSLNPREELKNATSHLISLHFAVWYLYGGGMEVKLPLGIASVVRV